MMIVVININSMKLAFLILGFIVSAVSMVRREARDGVRVGTDKVLNRTEAEERLEARRKLSVEPPAIVKGCIIK